MVHKYFSALADRAATHVLAGTRAAALMVKFGAAFEAQYKVRPVNVASPDVRAKRKRARADGARTLQERAKAIVEAVCDDLPDEALLAPLLRELCDGRLRQCLPALPSITDSAAGCTSTEAQWARMLASQGPLMQGHWLLSTLREAVGRDVDSHACETLARSIMAQLLECFRLVVYRSTEGLHIFLSVRVSVCTFTGTDAAAALWEAFLQHYLQSLAKQRMPQLFLLRMHLQQGSSCTWFLQSLCLAGRCSCWVVLEDL
jgi:hypothetical protein